MKAIIQAGGAGTRLKTITKGLPKPLVPIAGKPIIEWILESLKNAGVKEIIVIKSQNGQAIEDYLGDGASLGLQISYYTEEEPLGTGGAIPSVASNLNDDFFLVFGDLLLDIDWQRMLRFHREKGSKITAFVHPNSHPFDSDLLLLDKDNRIVSVAPKSEKRESYLPNLVNAGVYACSPSFFKQHPISGKCDFEKTFLALAIKEGGAYGYRSSEYVKDAGTPERYHQAERDILNGIVHRKNLKSLQKAIFLDRDGTINVFGDFVRNRTQLNLIPTAAKAIKAINASDYLSICITNQPVIARGETTFSEMNAIHAKMESLLGEEGAYLDGVYYCPHHPDKGYPGEVEELKINCDCRKPKIGLLLRAASDFNINLSASWFIGDTKRDIQTGINAGCKTALLLSGDPNYGHPFEGATPTFEAYDILEAVNRILENDYD